ncbi:MAG: hypothetical protein ACJAT4_001327 [Granulosicoccus sp.]|jgi:hypothetical protein
MLSFFYQWEWRAAPYTIMKTNNINLFPNTIFFIVGAARHSHWQKKSQINLAAHRDIPFKIIIKIENKRLNKVYTLVL